MARYNTNLAAEFYVLSMLYRLGADANLTLGNKKAVDISVIRGEGDVVTIDVKGLEGKTGWPIDNLDAGNARHYIAFVCFQGKIGDPSVAPVTWIVPSLSVKRFTYRSPKGRRLVNVRTLETRGEHYKGAWNLLS